MEDLTAWLRATIEADLAQAKAADEAAPGPWVNAGQAGLGDAWQIHGGPSGEEEPDWGAPGWSLKPVPVRVATLNYDDGGGVWEKAAADHIVLQQPRDTIARCEAELSMLDLHPIVSVTGWGFIEWAPGAKPFGCELCHEKDGLVVGAGYCVTLKMLASGRRHRPGFNPAWLD